MALNALGIPTNEDEVNQVMGARPLQGASWEQVLAAAQHFGCRATLTMPSTILQLKRWTDKGVPVLIAWNPEGRDWSHASVVFDVVPEDDLARVLQDFPDADVEVGSGLPSNGHYVLVADPNIPNPKKTVRVVHEDSFYAKWYEKWPNYLVRRPAVAIEREVTKDGRQVMASRVIKDKWGRAWGPKRGLEGPFKFRSGVVLYYDPREGAYYDPTSDVYLDPRDYMGFAQLTGEIQASPRRVAKRFLHGSKSKSKPKRRNHVVLDSLQRGWGSGPHGGTKRMKNRRDRQNIKKTLRKMEIE